MKRKLGLLVLIAIFFSNPNAQACGEYDQENPDCRSSEQIHQPKAVLGVGSDNQGDMQTAKNNAIINAELKCGGPVEPIEDLGTWKIVFYPNPGCRGYCTDVTAYAENVFVCALPKQVEKI